MPNLLCVSECMYVSMCICVYMYVCMYDVRHDIQIPCTRYVTINRLYLYMYLYFSPECCVLLTMSAYTRRRSIVLGIPVDRVC